MALKTQIINVWVEQAVSVFRVGIVIKMTNGAIHFGSSMHDLVA
jgi:hypothetical protein